MSTATTKTSSRRDRRNVPNKRLLRQLKQNSIRERRSAHRLRLESPLRVDTKAVQRAFILVEASGVAPYLDRRLHAHPGSKSQLTSFALVVGTILSFQLFNDVRRVSVTKVLSSMRTKDRANLGLYDKEFRPLSYDVIQRQLTRLERALREGWIDPDGVPCDLDSFTSHLIKASIPQEHLAQVNSIAVDATSLETWAVTRHFGKVSLATDPMARYQVAVLQSDVPEPVVPHLVSSGDQPPQTSRELLGTLGHDGRKIVSFDPDARAGYRTATRRKRSGYFAGYHLHLGVSVPGFRWNGDPASGRLEHSDATGYILAGVVVTASSHAGHAGTKTVDLATVIAPGISEVIVDRGYTSVLAETFLRKMHMQGFNVVMDYNTYQLARIETTVMSRGSKNSIFLSHAGVLYHTALPLGQLDLSGAQRSTDSAVREAAVTQHNHIVGVYRWSEHQRLVGGRIRFKCPFHSGRATNPALNRGTITNGSQVPFVEAPEGMDHCCAGITTLPVEQLDLYQQVPWGTNAWEKSYGRRQLVETANSRIKTKLNADKGLVCAFGIAAMTVGVAAMIAALNMEVTLEQECRESMSGPGSLSLHIRSDETTVWLWAEEETAGTDTEPDPPPKDPTP